MSSILPPARPGSGVRPVQSVIGPAREKPGQPRHEASDAAAGRGQAAWRDRDRLAGEGFIEAEFVEILREASTATAAIDPADETLRQALAAYRRAGSLRSILGSLVDIPI